MKKAVLPLILLTLTASLAFAATEGFDRADNPAYDDGWTNGDDGGTIGTFGPWNLTDNNAGPGVFAGYFIGDSTAGGANINTDGVSFGIFANPGGAFATAVRDFGTALTTNDRFSVDLAVNFRNGNKGFDLRDANGTTIFNLNIGGDTYTVNGNSIFNNEYSSNTVFSIQLTQTDATSGTWTVTRSGGLSGEASGAYTGVGASFKFYVTGTDGGSENNLYFNNLAVTAIPEPSTLSLLGASAVFAALYARRRRR